MARFEWFEKWWLALAVAFVAMLVCVAIVLALDQLSTGVRAHAVPAEPAPGLTQLGR